MSRPCHPGRLFPRSVRASGVTLIELLCAMVVAGLLVAVLFTAYSAVMRTAGHQAGTRAASAASVAADILARDFMCAMVPANLTNPPLLLTAATGNVPGSFCVFYTAEPWSPAHGPHAYAVREVRLGLRPGAHADAYVLERISRPAPPPESTNIVRETWAPVRAMAIEVRDGQDWTNRWENADLPQAVRLRLAHGATPAETIIMEIPVPAGIPFGPTNAVREK